MTSKKRSMPHKLTAITTAVLLVSAHTQAAQLIANGTTQSADGDYSMTGTGSAGYSLWAQNNGVINSEGATSLSISSATSSAIVAQTGGQVTLGGNGLGRFNVTSGGSGVATIAVSGVGSKVSLTGADVKNDLGSSFGTSYGVTLTGNNTLNLTDSTISASVNTAGAGNRIYGIYATGTNNVITLNNVEISAKGPASTNYAEDLYGLYMAQGTLTGDQVKITATSASGTNAKSALYVGGGVADLSNITFASSGSVGGGVYAMGGTTTLRGGTVTTIGAGVYNASGTNSILNAYDIDTTYRGSGQSAGSANGATLNITRGSLTSTNTNAILLYGYSAVNLVDTALTMNYGATQPSSGYLMQAFTTTGKIDANHVTANALGNTVNGASVGLAAQRGGQIKFYNGSTLNVRGYTALNYPTVKSYGALIQDAGSKLFVNDSTITTTAPRATDAVVGIQAQTGGSAVLNNATVSTNGLASGSHALVVADASSSIITNGGSISTGGAGSYGAKAMGGGVISLTDTAVATSGAGSYGLTAEGGSTVNMTGGALNTLSNNSFGIYLAENGSIRNTVNAEGLLIVTSGQNASGVSNHFGNTVHLTDLTINTLGAGSHGIDNSGASLATGAAPLVSADNVTIVTSGSGSHGALASDGGQLTITNSDFLVEGSNSSALVVGGLYAGSLATIDPNVSNNIIVNNTKLESVSGTAISAFGGSSTIALTDSTVASGAGVALHTEKYANSIASLNLSASNSTLTGAITTVNDGSTANISLTNGTQWNVGGNSNMTHLTLDDATLRYDAAAALTTNITLASGGATVDTNNFNAIFSGAITGSGSLTKNGLGTFTLSGIDALGYTGNTMINDGVLALRNLTASEASTLDKTFILNGGWLDLSETSWDGSESSANDWQNVVLETGANAANGGVIGRNDKLTYDIAAGDTTSVDYQLGKEDGDKQGLYIVKTGDGTLVLNHENEYKGYTKIEGGVVQISADNNLGDSTIGREVVLAGGHLQITADLDSARALELRADGSLIVDASVIANWNGGILESGGSFDFTKDGSGTLVLGGAASQTGSTVINAGTLQAAAENLFSSNDAMQINSGTTLDLDSYNQRINHLSGSGDFHLGTATAVLNNAVNRDTSFSGVIAGEGNLAKIGQGTLTLESSNTYTGGTVIAEGTIKATVDDVIAESEFLTVDGTFDLNDTNQNVNQLAGSGQVLLGTGSLIANNALDKDSLFSGVISGSGDLNKTGEALLVLSGENTYEGGTTVTGGTLQIGNGGTSGSILGNVTNDATLGFNRSDDVSYNGVISGSGDVYKDGNGSLLLNEIHTYTGNTEVRGGTLIVGDETHTSAHLDSTLVTVSSGASFGGYGSVVGDVSNEGTLAVANAISQFTDGAVGTFTVGGNFTNSGNIAMGGTVAGSRLVIEGDYVANDGQLTLTTVLGGDNSATDKLIVKGSTSGETSVTVNGIGEQGAQTVNGIRVIEVGGASNGVFTLSNRVVAGPFEYSLFKGAPTGANGNWYLRSEQAGGKEPMWRPEVGAYLGNQYLANAMQMHTLYDRQNARFSDQNGSAWGRVITSHTKSEAADGNITQGSDYSLVHFGSDFGVANVAGGKLHLGGMGSYGDGRTDANARGNDYQARGDIDGYNLGLYATWYDQPRSLGGVYVDSWMQYGWYNNKVQGDKQAQEKYDSQAWSASVEAGYDFVMTDSKQRTFHLIPQFQAAYSYFDGDDHREKNGSLIHNQNGGSLVTRLGVRIAGEPAATESQVRPFAEINWWHTDKNNSMDFNEINVGQGIPKDRAEIKMGVQGNMTKNLSGWMNVGLQSDGSEYYRAEGMAGLKYVW